MKVQCLCSALLGTWCSRLLCRQAMRLHNQIGVWLLNVCPVCTLSPCLHTQVMGAYPKLILKDKKSGASKNVRIDQWKVRTACL